MLNGTNGTGWVGCSEKVWRSGSFRPSACQNAASVVRENVPYCGTHDPERIAKRDAEKRAERDRERARNAELESKARKLVKVIGGYPAFDRHDGGYTGGVVLTAVEAQQLADELTALRAMWCESDCERLERTSKPYDGEIAI